MLKYKTEDPKLKMNFKNIVKPNQLPAIGGTKFSGEGSANVYGLNSPS